MNSVIDQKNVSTTRRWAEEQKEVWNGQMGETWVTERSFIDGMLEPFLQVVIEKATEENPREVLDVGCGNGTTTFAIARALPQATVTGIDLSQAMINSARMRGLEHDARTSLLAADAATHYFENKKFDYFTSRFGCMFFADPVAAFSNFRKMAADQAQLSFLVWRTPQENTFMTTGQRVAASRLQPMPPRDPRTPGPFAFGDTKYVSAILEKSGWSNVVIEPLDVTCQFDASDLDGFVRKLSPVSVDTHELPEGLAEEIYDATVAELRNFEGSDGQIRFNAAVQIISATADNKST